MSGRWVDLREAAELLDTSTEAVRKRAARGSLRSERQNGRVLVWVDEGRTEGGREAQVDRAALLEAKDETITLLRDQLRLRAEEIQRRDVIISQLTQATSNLTDRLRELEAPAPAQAGPQEPPGSPETVEAEQELDTERARREMAESTLHDGMDEERWRREEAERGRDELSRELYALRQQQRESPQTAAEEPEGAQPRPDAPVPQEGAQRPWYRRWFGG